MKPWLGALWRRQFLLHRLVRAAAGMLVWLLLLTSAQAQDLPPRDPDQSFHWIDASGQEIEFPNLAAIEQCLGQGRVIEAKKIPTGINQPYKLTLESDGVTIHAIFRTVDIFKQFWRSPQGLKVNFHDYYLYERAAFNLAQLFALGHVPPVVVRTFRESDFESAALRSALSGKPGTVQAWVEQARTEKDRRRQKLTPPDTRAWVHQHQMLYLFDNLLFNDDRNMGNILIDSHWRLWFIDQTRAFRPFRALAQSAAQLKRCDRVSWERLQTVTDDQVRSSVESLLAPREVETLLARRRLLIEHFQRLITERGEASVLFDFRLE